MALTTEQLNQIYMEELGRPAAAEGIQYWTQGGTSLSDPAQIRQAIAQSQEAQAFKSRQPVATPAPPAPSGYPTQPAPPAPSVPPMQTQTPVIPSQPASTDSFPVAPFANTVASGVTPQVASMALRPLGFGGGGVDRQIDFGGGIDPNEVMYRADVDPTADLDAAYTSALGRTIGNEGKTFWRSEIDKAVASGVPYQTALNNAIAAITSSEEATNFKTTGVARSDVPGSTVIQPAFTPVQPADIQGDLDAIYRSVLGPNRGIQQEGLDHFTADYNRYRQQGATHEQALANIRASVEQSSEADVYQGKVAQLTNSLNSLYTDLLGRGIGKTGLNYWTDEYNKLVGQGMNATDAMNAIRNSIMQSEEYQIYQQTRQPYVVPDDEKVDLPPAAAVLDPTMTDIIEERMLRPELPKDGRFDPAFVQRDPSQIIGTDSGIGQVGSAQQAIGATMGTAMTAGAVTPTATQTMQSQMASPQVNAALDKINPALGSVSEKAQIEAVTMSPTSTDVGTISPAQLAEAQRVQQPQSRTLQSGEMVQSAVDAQKATAFVEEVQSASADPSAKATVQGQLADLMSQFEDGAIPSWASGAMRTANATLAARGLGASSLAGQAVVQAAMESAIPIAVQDAQTQSQFEQQNLSNRQQRAMLAAQQRAQFMGQEFDQEFQARVANAAKISDIANMNFTAEQQIALENARLAQSVDLANLSNQQAMVMAETAQISQLELSNLNNRQQAAVQNAQSFLQMDLTNLSNTQQTTMFDAQSRVNALFSDAAAENAARQFNATSENQTNQFFQSLQTQVQQFNANQLNTMEQIRLEQTNIMSKFNAQLMAQQEQFNATNQLAIAQSDAQWNRQLATLDTAAINSANQFNAQAILEMSNQAFANAAQILRDQMDYAFQAGQKDADRELQIVIQKMSQDASKYAADAQEDAAWSTAVGTLAAAVLL